MFKTVIFDIDGVLADNRHRLHLISKEKQDWDSFFAELSNDEPFHNVIRLYNALLPAHNIIICTGRPEEHRARTRIWLNRHSVVNWDEMMMRPTGDYRPAVEVKREMLYRILNNPERKDIAFVFEDEPKLVKMYRDLGITCFQHDLAGLDF